MLLSSLLSAGPALAQDDVGAAREAICCGASCCFIDGNCRTQGQRNPTNCAQICDPAQSQTEWTDTECIDAGSPGGGGGGGCSVGSAGAGSSAAAFFLALAGLALLRRRR